MSSCGRVRIVARTVRCAKGFRTLPAKVLATAIGGRANNYTRVSLYGKDTRRHAYIHHLVLEAFVGPRPEWAHVCHRNDVGSDNRLENLYYGTPEENLKDRARNRETADERLAETPF